MVPVYLLLLASAAAGQAPGRPHILSIIVDECARLESADAVSAEETYREIIARLPRHAAAAYYNLGVALVEAGRLDEAERAYRSATALEPTRAEAYCNIGVVFKMTNRVDDAVRAFEQCLRLSPEFALGRKNLSLVLTDQGTELKKKSLPEAVATYERALTYDSTNVEAYSLCHPSAAA